MSKPINKVRRMDSIKTSFVYTVFCVGRKKRRRKAKQKCSLSYDTLNWAYNLQSVLLETKKNVSAIFEPLPSLPSFLTPTQDDNS